MNADGYHPSLRPLEEACRLAESGWICLTNPLTGYGRAGTLLWKACVFIRHAGLVRHCWQARGNRNILVREFSTWPLLLVFPLLLPLRKKLFFVINHNLQWAVRSRMEYIALAALARLGARWALFETQEFAGLTAFNIPSVRNLVLPHPVSFRAADRKNNTRPVVGVAGYYRPEKGMDELLRRLTAKFPDCDIVAGIPNPEAVNIPAVRGVSTASDSDYYAMLAQCDVLVQNGARDSYFYRVSGPVADAAGCAATVVVPDFPLLRQQISFPVRIGETFRTVDEMTDSVQAAIECRQAGLYDFTAYCAARSVQALAKTLDDFSRSSHE